MKRVLLALAIATTVAACATATSPTGRTQRVGAVSQEQLNQMGVQAFEQAQTAYVRCVANAVTRQLPSEWQANWEVALFADNSANAFALPGGKIGVNTGIFSVAKNQDQLAAVIAHEVGHVISRHHDERLTRQAGAQAGVNILGALIGSRYGTGAAQTTGQIAGIGAQTLILLPNNRTQETEADVVGQQLMAKAGFNPDQAVSLWQNMIEANAARSPEWLSTHPNPENRISELRSRAASLLPTYQQARASGHTPKCG
jgi:predicted Zn-dependent protease